MAKFIAFTSKGLTDILETELRDFNFKNVKKQASSVSFECSWSQCYFAHLALRTATRIAFPIRDFKAYKPDELYHLVQKIDFSKYFDPNQSFKIDLSATQDSIAESHFLAFTIKDAIVDQFRDKFNKRPNVDTQNPDFKLLVRCQKNIFNLSIDLTGPSLSQRGYRKNTFAAPLREHLAAGLLLYSNFKKYNTIVDPMCGSGTLLIEAARAISQASVHEDRRFLFQNLKTFKSEDLQKAKSQLDKNFEPQKIKLIGLDQHPEALTASYENAKAAGVDHLIEFKQQSLKDLKNEYGSSGLIITNPPYGERLSEKQQLESLYADFGQKLKQEFGGWDLWMLSGESEALRALKFKTSQKIPVWNGNIECRFLKYQIRSFK